MPAMTGTNRSRAEHRPARGVRTAWPGATVVALVVFALGVAMGTVPSTALAQSGDVAALQDRIARLEQDLANLRRMVTSGSTLPRERDGASDTGDQVPPTFAAQMQVRMSEIDEQMRTVTGQIEELSFRVEQMNNRLDTALADIEYRLSSLEGNEPGTAAPSTSDGPPTVSDSGAGTAEGGPTPVTPPTGNGSHADGGEGGGQMASVSLPEGTPSEQYDYAKSLLRKQDYAEAEAALQAFIDAHPDSPLAGNAYYWLGETHYVRGDFEQAILRFGEGYKKFPEHPKGPDNLLKLAMSLGRSDRTPQACAAFTEFSRKYADAGANLSAIAEKEKQRLGC